jgi:hypothetical protein
MVQQTVLCERHTGVCIIKETLWKNNHNFIKDVPVIYVNFVINVIIVKVEGNHSP